MNIIQCSSPVFNLFCLLAEVEGVSEVSARKKAQPSAQCRGLVFFQLSTFRQWNRVAPLSPEDTQML